VEGLVTTGTESGSVGLNAGGKVYMTGNDPVTTDYLEAVADDGLFLRTQINTLDAHIETEGILEIREKDDVLLYDVTNNNGPIRVIAGGTITAKRVECLTDEKGNNVGLISLGGDILVDYIGVGIDNGQISLSAAGRVSEVDIPDRDDDLIGNLGILIGQDGFGYGCNSRLNLETDLKRLYKNYGHSIYWTVYDDIELFLSVDSKLRITAYGSINVIYLDSNDHDIYLRSKTGDITIETMNAGDCRGDIELKAAGAVTLAGKLFGGDTGQIIAGDDLEIYAGDQVEFYGNVNAGDDVEIWANNRVYVDAPLTARDDIEIGTCGTIATTSNAPLTAGDDIELNAKGLVTIGGEVIAEDDVWIKSTYGNVMINDGITAGDWVDINAGNDLIINAGIMAGSELELYAKNFLTTTNASATLTAGGDVELETRWGDILLKGTIQSGNGRTCSPDVEIDSGGNLSINGAITSQDDVDLWADGEILISAPITAVDDIEIGTCGDLTTTVNAPLVAGDDIELYTKGMVTLGAHVLAGDDVDVWAHGGIIVGGEITAVDEIEIGAGGDLTTTNNAHLTAGDDIELYAGKALTLGADIRAGDDVDIWADDGVYIDAPVMAVDDIEIGTCGGLTTTLNAPLVAGDDIELYAKGSVTIGALIVAGDDVWIKSTYGKVSVNGGITAGDSVDIYAGIDLIISAGIMAGSDLELYAKYALTTNASATLTAGVDVELETRWGDIELCGAILSGNGQTCSPDIEIDSGGSLFINGAIISLDDVEIWADDEIFIDAPIIAVDEIEIGTCGTLTIMEDASLATGGDIELFSKKLMTIYGSIVSTEDDVEIYSYDDIIVSGAIEAVDRIEIITKDNLRLLDSSSLTGLNDEAARLVYLRAGDDITLDGQISAERRIIR
jgi:hypothetical protein